MFTRKEMGVELITRQRTAEHLSHVPRQLNVPGDSCSEFCRNPKTR